MPSKNQLMNKYTVYMVSFLLVISCLSLMWALSNFKTHDFQGKCLLCHATIPAKDAQEQNLSFVDDVDKLCAKCHEIDKQKSHPIKVKPNKDIPLTVHLDKDGLVTCTTCHDVHKEDKTEDRSELSGLLWGHVKGRTFCALCHNREALDSTWQHQTAIPYAHSYGGKFAQGSDATLLDKFSTECLSCHDGTISKFPQVEVKQGVWQHGIGMSHPVGVEYPRSVDFTAPELLPKEIRIFDGKIGCLSCHEIYNDQSNMMLTMDNRKSSLCLACHKK